MAGPEGVVMLDVVHMHSMQRNLQLPRCCHRSNCRCRLGLCSPCLTHSRVLQKHKSSLFYSIIAHNNHVYTSVLIAIKLVLM